MRGGVPTTTAKNPARTPWRFLFVVFFLLSLVTTAVPVVNWARRPPNAVFTGYSYESVGDIFVYLNFIDQAKHGAMLFENFFTPEPHGPILFHPLFLILGRLAALTHLSSLVVWHLSRVALLAPLLWVIWKCAERFFQEPKAKKLAVLFIVVTGSVASSTSEGSTFLMMLYSPKAILTLLCTLLFFFFFLVQYERRSSALRISAMFLLASLQAFVQPYVILVWAVAPVAFLFVDFLVGRFRWRAFWLVLASTTLPVALSLFLLGAMVQRDPLLDAWSRNAYGFPYPWHTYLLALGALLPVALVGLFHEGRRVFSNPFVRFFLLLLLTTVVLSLSPYPYSYRLLGYVHIPLALFAAGGTLVALRYTAARPVGRVVLLLFLALSVSDNVRHIGLNLTGAYLQSENRFLDADEASGLRWLREETPEDSRILASPAWDTLLAEQAYRHVYTSSGWQTTSPVHRIQETLAIYRGDYTPLALDAFLSNNAIRYLVVSDREKIKGHWRSYSGGALVYDVISGYNLRPERYPFLKEVYANPTFSIYRFQPSDDSTIL